MNPMTALEALRTHLLATMEPLPAARLTAAQVLLEPPDPDSMPFPEMLYLVLERGTAAPETYSAGLAAYQGSAFIIIRQSSTNTSNEKILQAAMNHCAAFCNAIITDPTLSGAVLKASVEGWDLYPAVEGLTNATGIEIAFTLHVAG